MYEGFHHLNELPFENVPDPRFFFASDQHREALAAIEYTIRMRKGLVMVSGDVGTGKTTVGQTMREHCHDEARVVEVTFGHRERDELLRQILRHMGLQPAAADHSAMIDCLREYLHRQIQEKRPVVLFVDEAQTLSDEALEEVRLLGSLDTARARAVQVVLLGQSELRHRLRAPRHGALRQRIVMARHLEPFGTEDTVRYVHHRLVAAGAAPDQAAALFPPEVLGIVHHYTHGIPRMINTTCDNCLLLAFVREQTAVTAALVHSVIAEMAPGLDTPLGAADSGAPASPSLALAGA